MNIIQKVLLKMQELYLTGGMTAIAEIRKCKVVDAQKNSIEDTAFSPKIQSLIGVVPDFSPKDLDKDERLKHIFCT